MEVSGQTHAPAALPRGSSHGASYIRRTIAGSEAVEKRKICRPVQKSNPGLPARSQSLYRLSYPGSMISE
jgi:hypothetical protein